MINARRAAAVGLPVTIKPPFGEPRELNYGAFEFASIAHVDRRYVHVDRRCGCPDGVQLADPNSQGRLPKNSYSRHARSDLFEQFHPFRAHTVFKRDKPSGVAAWTRHAGDKAGADRINGGGEHDWYRSGRFLQRNQRYGGGGSGYGASRRASMSSSKSSTS
jgi:hypothetical protein